MNHSFYVYPVINEVVVLIKIVEEIEFATKMLQRINILSKYRHKVGICGTVLTVQFLPSGEHKNYDHVLTSNSTNTKHISGE